MEILNEQKKRDLLQDLLIELSKSQDILKESGDRVSFFKRLESIYYNRETENFRHYYSDIFSTLSIIDGDSDIGSLDVLAQNIRTIKNEYTSERRDEDGNLIDIRKEIDKLYDHTNLDIARINYTKSRINKTQSELVKNKALIDGLKETIQSSEQELTKLSENTIEKANQISEQVQTKQEDMQKEYITILGIFAAIVLAFTGGMAFSSSVLENIHKASVYRVALIAFIIGLVFFNLIWLLIDFIRDINGKEIRKKWLWLLVNLILIVGIIGTCFSYKYEWFTKESRIETEQSGAETDDIPLQ